MRKVGYTILAVALVAAAVFAGIKLIPSNDSSEQTKVGISTRDAKILVLRNAKQLCVVPRGHRRELRAAEQRLTRSMENYVAVRATGKILRNRSIRGTPRTMSRMIARTRCRHIQTFIEERKAASKRRAKRQAAPRRQAQARQRTSRQRQ